MKPELTNPLSLIGYNILITGASSGIGREAAILLSGLGARIILVARREQELLRTRELMVGDYHLIEVFDLSNLAEISHWMETIAEKVGSLRGLVHCAGIQVTQPTRFVREKDLATIFAININSAIFLAKAFRQKRVYLPNSSMVFLASVYGMVGSSGVSIYSASKGAIIALTKSLALEFARDTIRVNCVAPGLVKTEMFEKWVETISEEQRVKILEDYPIGIGTPRDVANAIAFLLADTARWITGTTLVVDGGYTAH